MFRKGKSTILEEQVQPSSTPATVETKSAVTPSASTSRSQKSQGEDLETDSKSLMDSFPLIRETPWLLGLLGAGVLLVGLLGLKGRNK